MKNVCSACGFLDLSSLPVPHPSISMLSDGQRLPYVLRKLSCSNCGYGFHASPPDTEELRKLFDEKYNLGQRDTVAETRRAAHYFEAILSFLGENRVSLPDRVLEMGCGMGSLLTALSSQWKCSSAIGLEPSPVLAEAASLRSSAGVSIYRGFAEDFHDLHVPEVDLCLSVNVIEHSISPETFLLACNNSIRSEGNVLVICPDGENPSSELLFYDHLSSLTTKSLSIFGKRAGLELVASHTLTGPLQGFAMHLFQQSGRSEHIYSSCPDLSARRAAYLNTWCDATKNLTDALKSKPYAIFGAGEYADLLAAYCPDIVQAADGFAVDAPTLSSFHSKPIFDMETLLKSGVCSIVAAVHERSWPAIHRRFSDLGKAVYHPCIQTSDIVAL
ncbi:class I SAM-dependent methyltransferase [Roseobacter sp. S98]|uniref:class I SAM-dependent methyltransferase n=1 Tax=Roseobacter algicola (ex Choi et al. 2025) (nom. illeg.) TaxID=3092138 RepID=UPI003F511B00